MPITNLIRTPEGDFKIIDLESAVVTLLPAPGQWRSALSSGSLPVFDDIAFLRLRGYISDNEAGLEASLGAAGLAELRDATDRAEEAINQWKEAEPRVWGHIIGRVYRLLNLKAYAHRLKGTLAGADRAGDRFLRAGVDRWEREGRLAPPEAAALRDYLSSGQVVNSLHHLGAHMVISAVLRFPIGSAVLLAWTMFFWCKTRYARCRGRNASPEDRATNIHTLPVMLLSLVPGLGTVAYALAPPLRRKHVSTLLFDQVGRKLPFRLYTRTRLERWLVPSPARSRSHDIGGEFSPNAKSASAEPEGSDDKSPTPAGYGQEWSSPSNDKKSQLREVGD